VETLARLVTHFRDYHSIKPCRATLDLDAERPACAAGISDTKGRGKPKDTSSAFAVVHSRSL